MVTCMYPHRHPVTGRFCRTRGIWIKGHYRCPHHIGVERRAQEEEEE